VEKGPLTEDIDPGRVVVDGHQRCSSEPLTEVLPNRLLGPAQYRYIPHIYTDAEIQDLLKAATDLRPRGGLRAQSVLTYLGLLACTGMRPREPLRLNRGDVDLQGNVLTVRQTTSREIPPPGVHSPMSWPARCGRMPHSVVTYRQIQEWVRLQHGFQPKPAGSLTRNYGLTHKYWNRNIR
jgi:integrase